MNKQTIYDKVSEHYSSQASSDQVAAYGQSVAKSFGYSEEELAAIPTEANLGLSCGNPLAITSLKEGETIIDLGSGAGFDVFLASKKVGLTGRAIGVDMNKEMLALAMKNKAKAGAAADNVSFVDSQITSIGLDDHMADCIISNCVINLVPEGDKQLVFNEMARLLKAGGRVAVSDILAKKPLPDFLRKNMALYAGCIGGASQVDQYKEYLTTAGFTNILLTDTKSDLNVYIDTLPDGTKKMRKPQGGRPGQSSCCSSRPQPQPTETPKSGPAKDDSSLASLEGWCCVETLDLNEWVGSFKIYAVKN